MRICFVNQDMALGGSATVVYNIVSHWPNTKDKLFLIVFFDIFAERYKDLFHKPNLKIIFLHKKKTIDIGFLRRLKKTIRFVKPDVINSHLTSTFYLNLINATKICKIYHTIHSEPTLDMPNIYRWFLRKNIKNRKIKLIGCCDYISKKASLLYKEECRTITNAIEKINFQSPSQSKKVRFLFVGRICEVKNVVEIIEAFGKVKGRNFSFTICGKGSGEYFEKVLNAINTNPNREHIVFVGEQNRLENFYSNADVLVLTSKREGMPITILEGLQYGLGFLVTDVGAISEMVKNNINGLYIKNDLSDLTESIDFLISNPLLIKSFKNSSLSNREDYSAENMSKKYMELLKNE